MTVFHITKKTLSFNLFEHHNRQQQNIKVTEVKNDSYTVTDKGNMIEVHNI